MKDNSFDYLNTYSSHLIILIVYNGLWTVTLHLVLELLIDGYLIIYFHRLTLNGKFEAPLFMIHKNVVHQVSNNHYHTLDHFYRNHLCHQSYVIIIICCIT